MIYDKNELLGLLLLLLPRKEKRQIELKEIFYQIALVLRCRGRGALVEQQFQAGHQQGGLELGVWHDGGWLFRGIIIGGGFSRLKCLLGPGRINRGSRNIIIGRCFSRRRRLFGPGRIDRWLGGLGNVVVGGSV